jgi:hypothetical protein
MDAINVLTVEDECVPFDEMECERKQRPRTTFGDGGIIHAKGDHAYYGAYCGVAYLWFGEVWRDACMELREFRTRAPRMKTPETATPWGKMLYRLEVAGRGRQHEALIRRKADIRAVAFRVMCLASEMDGEVFGDALADGRPVVFPALVCCPRMASVLVRAMGFDLEMIA